MTIQGLSCDRQLAQYKAVAVRTRNPDGWTDTVGAVAQNLKIWGRCCVTISLRFKSSRGGWRLVCTATCGPSSSAKIDGGDDDIRGDHA